MSDRQIDVHGLARVEGEGSLHIRVAAGKIEQVSLSIFEPPRFFEALLRGRRQSEAPDITARICGICPVAYQMSACAAIEAAAGVEVDSKVASLRRLLYCGEWIQSHSLHIHLLHAPDFFGCADAVELAERAPEAVQRGLRIKKAGNALMAAVGGRAIHPVNVRVGGFYSAPTQEDLAAVRAMLLQARDDALDTVDWVNSFEFPDLERDYLFVALRPQSGYPIDAGSPAASSSIRSSAGLDTSPAQFLELVTEEHVSRSTALHAHLAGGSTYLTGPLARYALNRDRLTGLAAEAARSAGLGSVECNPFRSVVVRAVELVLACDESLRLISEYEPPEPPAAFVPPAGSAGAGATEAPRGLLVHRYEIDQDGVIVSARIMPPTSQNQSSIEEDLRKVVETNLDAPDEQLQWSCEQAVRNHDPCISCAAHFLDMSVERTP